MAAPDPSDVPFFLLLALAPLTVSMVASNATLRLWRRTPTNRVPTNLEALLALAVSVPLIGVALIGVLGGLWTVHSRETRFPWRAGSPSCSRSTCTGSFRAG